LSLTYQSCWCCASAQTEMPALPFEGLLSKHEPHLLRADRYFIVIKREHYDCDSFSQSIPVP
jgi:hypothetical protein